MGDVILWHTSISKSVSFGTIITFQFGGLRAKWAPILPHTAVTAEWKEKKRGIR